MAAAVDTSTARWLFIGVLLVALIAIGWVQVRYLQVMRAAGDGRAPSKVATGVRVFNLVLVIVAVGLAIWAVVR